MIFQSFCWLTDRTDCSTHCVHYLIPHTHTLMQTYTQWSRPERLFGTLLLSRSEIMKTEKFVMLGKKQKLNGGFSEHKRNLLVHGCVETTSLWFGVSLSEPHASGIALHMYVFMLACCLLGPTTYCKFWNECIPILNICSHILLRSLLPDCRSLLPDCSISVNKTRSEIEALLVSVNLPEPYHNRPLLS